MSYVRALTVCLLLVYFVSAAGPDVTALIRFNSVMNNLVDKGDRFRPTPEVFLNNPKTPQDYEMTFCHLYFTPLRHILHTLRMLIVGIATFCFQCVTSFFGMEK